MMLANNINCGIEPTYQTTHVIPYIKLIMIIAIGIEKIYAILYKCSYALKQNFCNNKCLARYYTIKIDIH